jgi:tRNA wybutosine-synthesizing protein 4
LRDKLTPVYLGSGADVFNKLNEYLESHPHEALLEPGDILFLPPLWLHSASPTSEMSIGVNIFFRNLTSGYAPGKDIYGNRDLQAYEKGRLDIARIIKSFEGLPVDIRGFYLQRLVSELEEASC